MLLKEVYICHKYLKDAFTLEYDNHLNLNSTFKRGLQFYKEVYICHKYLKDALPGNMKIIQIVLLKEVYTATYFEVCSLSRL